MEMKDRFLCDFCPASDAFWVFACEDFTVPPTPGTTDLTDEFVGAWRACERCKAELDKDDPDAFYNYVLQRFRDLFPVLPHLFAERLKLAHAGFWIHRIDVPPRREEQPIL